MENITEQSVDITFEESISRLESILKKMDNGEAALDEAMSLYKEGLNLLEICQSKLAKAQGQLQVFDGAWQKEENNG